MTPAAPSHRWLMVLTGVFVTLVVLAFGRLSYGVILPYMRQDLGLTYQQAGNLGTVTALGYLATVMLAGMIARQWGARNTVLAGVALVTAGFVGLTFATPYLQLAALMALLGVGTAFTYTPFISLLATWFPQQRGLVIGLATSGVGMGMFTVGFLMPYLAQQYGDAAWRAAWGTFALAGLLACALVLAFIRNPPAAPANPHVLPTSAGQAVYRNKRVVTVGLVYGIIGVSYIVQTIFMVSFMLDAGVPAVTAGRLVAINGLLSIFSGVAWGWLSDRLGRTSALMLAMSLVLLATLAPILMPVVALFTLHYLLLGCTVTGLFTLVQAAGTEQVDARDAPLALSYVTLFFAAGQFIGPALAGWLIDTTGGFRLVFTLTSLTLTLGLYLTYRLRVLSRPPQASTSDAAPAPHEGVSRP